MQKTCAMEWSKQRERTGFDADRFAEDHASYAYRLAMRLTASPEVAEDLAQSALLRALQASRKPESARERPWLRSIVVNLFLSQRKRRPELPLDEVATSWYPDQGLAVASTLSSLSPEHRAILALALGEGLSYREIAETLAIPEGTVASRLNAAKAAFRKAWSPS